MASPSRRRETATAFAAAIRAVLDAATSTADPDRRRRRRDGRRASKPRPPPSDGEVRPLIYGATAETWEAFAELAKSTTHRWPFAKNTSTCSPTWPPRSRTRASTDIVLDHGARDLPVALAKQTQMRRLALKKNYRPLGYPQINFPGECVDDAAHGCYGRRAGHRQVCRICRSGLV